MAIWEFSLKNVMFLVVGNYLNTFVYTITIWEYYPYAQLFLRQVAPLVTDVSSLLVALITRPLEFRTSSESFCSTRCGTGNSCEETLVQLLGRLLEFLSAQLPLVVFALFYRYLLSFINRRSDGY